MKAIFIAFNQAYNDEIVDLLERHGQRGFTRWNDILGRGGVDGEPHYGNHAWPVQNMAILTVVEDEAVEPIMAISPRRTRLRRTWAFAPLSGTSLRNTEYQGLCCCGNAAARPLPEGHLPLMLPRVAQLPQQHSPWRL